MRVAADIVIAHDVLTNAQEQRTHPERDALAVLNH